MTYQTGDRVALVHTSDPHTRLIPGTAGTVTGYDDRHGQLNVAWDDGSSLSMLLCDGDQVRLLDPPVNPKPESLRSGDGSHHLVIRSAGDHPARKGNVMIRHDNPDLPGAGSPQDITDPATGGSRLLSARCSTCILRPCDPMHLGPERFRAIIGRALAAGSYVVCHDTLTYGDFPDYGPAICRGFFDAYSGRSPALILLRAFRRLVEVPPPEAASPGTAAAKGPGRAEAGHADSGAPGRTGPQEAPQHHQQEGRACHDSNW